MSETKNKSLMPSSVESEKAVLGAILLNSELVLEAQAYLKPEDFFLDSHRRIFMAMVMLGNQGKPVDLLTISEQLENHRLTVDVAYLSGLIDGVPHVPSLAEWARIVAEKAKVRRLIIAGQKAAAKGIAGESADEILGELESDLLDLSESNEVKGLPQIGHDFLKRLHELRTMDRSTLGLSYGIRSLDKFTTGIREADYTIIAGRSGQGKSAFARLIAYTNAAQGVPVCVFTPEMTSEQFFSMLVPLCCDIPYFQIRDPRYLSKEQLQVVANVTDSIIQWPLHVDDKSGITIAELVAKARMQIARGAKLVIVDYLQLIQCPAAKTERERVNEVSAGLRNLAKQTRVPVIALSQLSRPNDRNANEKPTMFHLKESGNLETDAFNVLLLFRPQQDGQFTGDDEIILAKQRFGEAGTFVPVHFDKRRVTYQERA